MTKKVRQAKLPSEAYSEVIMDRGLGYYATKAKDNRGYVQCEGETGGNQCIANVNDRQEQYSKRFFGKTLCFNCQQKEKDKRNG